MTSARAGTIPQERSTSRLWSDRRTRLLLKLLLIVGFSALTAVAKRLHPSMGIPGSSAVFWLTAMVVGRSVVKTELTGTLTGLGVAAWGIPLGLEHTFGYNVLLYGASGLLLDVMTRLPKMGVEHPVGAALSGLVAHMAKYGFIVYAAVTASVTKHFIVVGFLNSAALHALFGAAAGIIGWAIVKTARYGFKHLSS
jgi:hypothetical protein